MLITTTRATPTVGMSLASSQTFSNTNNPSTWAPTGTYTPTTTDLVAALWMASNVIDTGMTITVNWGGAGGAAFSQQAFIGTQGGVNRAFVWIGTLRNVALTAASPYYAPSRNTAFSDLCLLVGSLKNWGGGVGFTGGTQTLTNASSVAKTFTPTSGGSFLIGAGGCFKGTATPFTVTGATKDAEQATGTGATTVDGAAAFFHQAVTTPASQTITVSSGASDPNWALGVVELY